MIKIRSKIWNKWIFRFPLAESEQKRLVKLYLNDVGSLTYLLYGINVNAVLQDIKSINLGMVYESVVAQELATHGFKLHYYDNKKKGEVDLSPHLLFMFLHNEHRDEPIIQPELEVV